MWLHLSVIDFINTYQYVWSVCRWCWQCFLFFQIVFFSANQDRLVFLVFKVSVLWSIDLCMTFSFCLSLARSLYVCLWSIQRKRLSVESLKPRGLPASCCTLIGDTKCGLCLFHEDWPMKVCLEAWWHLLSAISLNYSKTHSISVLNSDRGKWGQSTSVASWFGSVLSGLSFCLHEHQHLSG